ncbi:iron-containing alcohol dehydrogenase [Cupriavidus consociatus]|uniref:iron-containing alcohol dehydrogenase n=1 Tax=Cupriavidus consociatus TaxID=2821357 RepID=UPI001FD86696|nr:MULTISPECIES: iron-containing alcohol dehydrogenase [unclassified Cupriavidus]
MMPVGTYRYLPLERVHFGRPAAQVLAEEASQRGATRVFVVSSRTLNRTTSAVSGAIAGVRDKLVGLFDACVEHVPRDAVIALAGAMREVRPDLVVTIGGGTAIDTVKVALACLAQDVRTAVAMDAIRVRIDAAGQPQVPQITAPPCRQIAVPTTLSAAEFSDLAGCTDPASGSKHHVTANGIGPVSVILDPAITVHTPSQLWLSTGIRAIDHAVESVCSVDAQPMTDATCLHGLTLLAAALRRHRDDPTNHAARLDCQLGVWLCASGVNRVRYGASHGIGHVLGGALGVPHGITSCLLLPAVMRYNLGVTAPAQRAVARALGHDGADAAGLVSALIHDLGLPTRLRELDIGQAQFGTLAELALENQWVRANPRRIDRAQQVVDILQSAW